MALTVAAAPAGTDAIAGATTIATVFPAGYTVTANDLDVLVVISKNRTEATVPATPTNYTQLGTGLGGVTGAAVDAGKLRITVFTRELQVGNTAPTVGNGGGSATGPLMAGWHYILRRDAAGTYALIMSVLSEATSGLSWSEPMALAPDWLAGDHLLLPVAATTDSVAGFNTGTLTATGLTIGALAEDLDAATTQGDDARYGSTRTTVTAGPPSTAPVRGVTLTTTASTGAMGLIRVRHVPAGLDATATPATVAATASVGVPVVSTPSAAAAFTTGQSTVGGVDQLGLGATTQLWATLLPPTIVATASIPVPLLWGPPSGLTAVAISANLVRLTWNPVLAAEHYWVERDGIVLTKTVTATTYDDATAPPSTLLTYRVQAAR